ncbi:MAG: SDR family oxidoreductase [Polyangiaceae bacterium]|nr:SDR family oxidoreductase [Polyangiaceae bacterium]
MSLAGRKALVTGGGRGIGRAISQSLAEAGAHVIVAGRTAKELEETAALVGGTPLVLDVKDRTALAAVRERTGSVHILVNNAGIAESAPFDRTSDALWDDMMAVNVSSAFFLCRALVPDMVKAGWGRVVNLASNAGLSGYAYTTAYCASKHAMVGLTRALAAEIAKSGVTVNAVCPGWVDTQMTTDAVLRIAKKTGRSEADARKQLENMSPQGRLVSPLEVAHAVRMLCDDAALAIHGQTIVVDGGQVMK